MITIKVKKLKVFRFMHAGYKTIRLDSLMFKQKSVLKIFENWWSYGKKNCQKSAKL